MLLAARRGFVPLNPQLWGLPFLSLEEAALELGSLHHGEERTMLDFWMSLVEQLFVVFPEEELDLDRTTWDILWVNEQSEHRKPVLSVVWRTDRADIDRLSREEVLVLLRSNVTTGLAKGLI